VRVVFPAVRAFRLEPREMPLIVELAKLVFEMTPALVSEEKEAAPLNESDVPWPAVKKKFCKVEEAEVEVALKYGAPINVPASIPPENVEVAVEPRAMATVVVGASLLSALSSHALPKMEDERA